MFHGRGGELRQAYREGQEDQLNAIVLWNTVYLERAVQTLRAGGTAVPDELLQHLSPLAWEHIILTGEYRVR